MNEKEVPVIIGMVEDNEHVRALNRLCWNALVTGSDR